MPFVDNLGSRPRPADGTEGTASVILTLKDKQQPLELNGCIIANDENFKKLIEDDTILEQHEKTKFFIYFCCHENLELSNLVKTEIKVHRFTKPDRDKHCTIKHETDDVIFLQKECQVFLPVCHKDLKTRVFTKFCKKHSKKIPSHCHSIVNGKYKGTTKDTEKGSVKCIALKLTSRNGSLFMEESSFNKLVDGPLLLESNEVVGYCNKEQDGSRITVYKLGTQDTTTIQPISIATQDVTSTASGLSTLSAQGLELYSVNLKKAIEKHTDLQDKKMPNQLSVKTDDIFTNLTLHHQEQEMTHQRAQEVEALARAALHGRQRSLHQKRTHKVNNGARKTVTEIKQCREIFVGENKENNPKSILVSGEPGIGKTLFSQKIVRDWSTKILLIPDIKFTYLITFRKLARLANKELTLRELLNHSPLLEGKTIITEEIMAYVIQHPEQLFIVFDGFDEYKDRNKIIGDFEDEFPNDFKAKMPVAALVSKILRKKILSDSVTMITSRTSEATALNQKIHFQRYVEITGFSETEVVKYVGKYFTSKSEKERKMAVDKVKGSPHHISFGRAPFRCFLMCIFIESEIKNKGDISVPATLTQFYQSVIKFIELNYNRKILDLDEKAEAVDKTIDNFAELAANLTQQNRFSFTSEDLKNLNSTEKEMLLSSNLIFCYPVSSNSPFQKPTFEYSFTHFTIQEFFVAWYLVKKGVMAAQESTEMVYIFMSGLLGLESNNKSMVELLECLGKHIEDKERLRLVSLRCLHEFQDKSLTRQELTTNRDYRYWSSDGMIGLHGVTDTDCEVIAMLIEYTATSISSPPYILYIDNSSITIVGLNSLLSSLIHPNCTITRLWLLECDLNDECVKCLCEYLPNTNITELILDDNAITDVGVRHIINHVHTNLTHLELYSNQVSNECIKWAKQFCNDNHSGLELIM